MAMTSKFAHLFFIFAPPPPLYAASLKKNKWRMPTKMSSFF